MATHSSILAWKIRWTEKPGRLQSMGFQRVGHDWVNSLCGSAGKESAWNVGGLGSIPGLWRSPGEGKSYPLQYFGLENSIDYIVHGVAKSRTQLSDFHSPTHSVFGWVPSFLTLCETVLRWGPQSVRRFLRETELQVFKIVITSVLAWRIPGTREPGGLPSMGVTQSRTRLKRLSSSSSSSFLASFPSLSAFPFIHSGPWDHVPNIFAFTQSVVSRSIFGNQYLLSE